MNDRYLFRGKRVDNGEWVEGWITSQFKMTHDGKLLTRIQSKVFGVGEHLINTETVGQCTGLKDKNGKLIFEGDILIFTNDDGEKTPYKVCWSEKYVGYTIITNDGATDTMDYWDEWIEHYEAIGNIHDNPELLEVKE